MGTWDVGAFDNDTAADWCACLDAATPNERSEQLRHTLTAACVPDDTHLDSDFAFEAIAAAAVVASQLAGSKIETPYAPHVLLDGGTVEVPDDSPRLALRALDRVVGRNSEWRALWETSEHWSEATAALQSIRAALARTDH